jgi:hypothetical protein
MHYYNFVIIYEYFAKIDDYPRKVGLVNFPLLKTRIRVIIPDGKAWCKQNELGLVRIRTQALQRPKVAAAWVGIVANPKSF